MEAAALTIVSASNRSALPSSKRISPLKRGLGGFRLFLSLLQWYYQQIDPYNKELKLRSRELRSSMTDAEIKLWSKLRRKQLHSLQFCRQKPIGNFIVDFYCPKARLVIEIDGGQHYQEQGMDRDAARDSYLRGLGLEVIRFFGPRCSL